MGYLVFFLWIGIISCMISCSGNNDTNLEKAKQGMVSKIEYQGHSYVVWGVNLGGGITHDPDCNCYKIKDKQWKMPE